MPPPDQLTLHALLHGAGGRLGVVAGERGGIHCAARALHLGNGAWGFMPGSGCCLTHKSRQTRSPAAPRGCKVEALHTTLVQAFRQVQIWH